MSYTCPYCGAESWHPKDIQYGYCGRCHEFTRDKARREALQAQAIILAEQGYQKYHDADHSE